MLRYLDYNANPKDRKTGDCTTRALAVALNVSWPTALEMQYKTALDTFYEPSDVKVIDKILKKYGFVEMKRPIGYTVGRMDELMDKNDIVVCRVANHVVTCKNGYTIDI